jgi:pimeloyl-ACP methyl ester carboxylesterase
MFGKGGEPILLITGFRTTMDMWDPNLLNRLASSNHTVIVFDNRGMGKTTVETKEFSINRFANDAAGLLNALHINNATVLGWSMGGYVAQILAINYHNKVNDLIIYASDWSGKEAIYRNSTVIQEQGERFLNLLVPAQWLQANPDVTNYIPIPTETSAPSSIQDQAKASGNWSGSCNSISKINKPTLIITGTDDIAVPAVNSIILAEKIPGSWLIQIKSGGHGLMYQYPKELSNIILTFHTAEILRYC